MAIFTRKRFPPRGNERFRDEDPLHFAHGTIAVGILHLPIAVLIAATKPNALRHLLGAEAWASAPRTRALHLAELAALDAGLIDAAVLSNWGEWEIERRKERLRTRQATSGVGNEDLVWFLCCRALAEEQVFEACVGRHGEHGRRRGLRDDSEWWKAWWQGWSTLGHWLEISDLPSSYPAYRAYVARELSHRLIDPDAATLALDVCLRQRGPAARAAIVELLPEPAREALGLDRKGRAGTAAVFAGFLASRLFHRFIRRRRWPALIDYPAIARAAREKREAIEAEEDERREGR